MISPARTFRSALLRPLLFMLTAVLIATSCGIPEDDAAIEIPETTLPVELVGGPAAVPDAAEGATDRIIWMVDETDILEPVERAISSTPDAIMDSLLQGTFPVEREKGISSAIPRGTGYNPPISVDAESQIAFVDLTAGSLQSLGRQEREVAYAQIVTSLDELPEIRAVNFTIDGQFVSVQTSDGATTPGQAVSRSDFSSHQRIRPAFDEPEVDETVPPVPTPEVDTRSELAVWMFDGNERLVRVSRLIERSPEDILDATLGGPTIPEAEAGITTALAPTAVLVNLDIDEATGTALVDLTPVSLPSLAADMKLKSVAQIVYSLTELIEINGVVISIDGVRQAMPTDQGIVSAGTVLRREDFLELAPRVVGLDRGDSQTETDDGEAADDQDQNDPGTDDPDADDAAPDASGDPTSGDEPSPENSTEPESSSEPGPVAPTPTPDP